MSAIGRHRLWRSMNEMQILEGLIWASQKPLSRRISHLNPVTQKTTLIRSSTGR